MGWIKKEFEERMVPFIDQIYNQTFDKKITEIKRSNRSVNDELKFMDINLAIDTNIFFYDGTRLTLQEKSRQSKWKSHNDFTFEYFNDPETQNQGEWFKLAAQLYFYGYANKNETGYDKYWILDIPKLRIHLMENFTIDEMERKFLCNNKPPAMANFFAIPFSIIESFSGVVQYKS